MTAPQRSYFRTMAFGLLAFMVSVPLARAQELPEKYKRWLEEEVVYIISPRERQAFERLQSVQEREAFIEAFWRRRDPDLLTPVNEFREEHYRRLDFANRELGRESAVPGWMTDRGKIYIILGEPQDRETFLAVPGLYPVELWSYLTERDKALPPLYLLFFQEGFAGPYRLFNHLLDEPADLMPAQPFDPANVRAEAFEFLQTINPALAHASITMRADQGPFAGIAEPARSSLDFQALLAEIYDSPFRRLDTRWVDAVDDARGLVESDYLFNYVPSVGMVNVLPAPGLASFVHFTLEIEPQYITLAKEEGGRVYYTSFEVRGDLTTPDGKTIHQFSKELPLSLSESQFRDVMSRPFSYRDMFPVADGEYLFRVILKNRARSEYTIFESPVQVSERVPERPFLGVPVPLYGVTELDAPDSEGLYRTYQLGSLVLDPNAKRVYPIGEALVIYLPATNLSDQYKIAFRVVNRENPSETLSAKTVPGAITPLIESLSTGDSVGGHFELTTELIAENGETLSVRSMPFDVTPRAAVARPWVLRQSIDGENDAVVSAVLAEQYLLKGEASRARELSEQALAIDPNLLAARLLLGRMELDEGRFLEAIRLLEPARAQHPDNVEVLLALGDALFQAKNFTRAVELFEAAIPLRRPGTSLLNSLGIAHAQLGNRDKAIEYLTRSLELEPEQPSVLSLLEKLRAPAGN
ncbi:MAG TPA: GWxTD domain-containing protein [Vicinamibacteria bacterium]|nr:GWxTD domain-containing protein [Vicinamibacteria bacterium]